MTNPADPHMTMADIARYLNLSSATIRSYRRYGYLPVPDLCPGGWEAAAGEQIPAAPGFRDPRPGELIGGKPYWRRSTIEAWAKSRPGSGTGKVGEGRGSYSVARRLAKENDHA